MARLEELVETVAEQEGMDPATVRLIARNVREAGLITTGGRGTSAGQMTFGDAANLLIGVNASVNAREAPETVRKYRRMRPACRNQSGDFGKALEKLIEALATTRTLPEIYLSFSMPPVLSQKLIRNVEVTFHKPRAQARLYIALERPFESLGHVIFCHQLPGLTTRDARRVTQIYFDFELPPQKEEMVFPHPDGTTTFVDGTPYVRRLQDRRDTTVIGSPTINAVARLLKPRPVKRAK
jgi:hypothetical protein